MRFNYLRLCDKIELVIRLRINWCKSDEFSKNDTNFSFIKMFFNQEGLDVNRDRKSVV